MYSKIINIWRDEIENINVNGINRKVSSIDFFPMKSKYYPHSEAWKVNFNFKDGISSGNESIKNYGMWEIELNKHFILKFGDKYKEGPNSGELQFNNSLCEYMTYQGYRFIIQFYPDQFISILRDRKLNELGI
jgi:hypothetical protein